MSRSASPSHPGCTHAARRNGTRALPHRARCASHRVPLRPAPLMMWNPSRCRAGPRGASLAYHLLPAHRLVPVATVNTAEWVARRAPARGPDSASCIVLGVSTWPFRAQRGIGEEDRNREKTHQAHRGPCGDRGARCSVQRRR
jgi:hypothetical protein